MAATNTLTGVNLARIAQKSLDALVTELVPLKNAFLTDFTSEVQRGSTITTRYPTQPVVKALKTAADRVSGNSTLTAVTVNVGDPRGIDIGFNDVEIANSEIALQQLFIGPGVVAIVEDIMAQVFAVVTNANFPQKTDAISAANFGTDSMARIAQLMSTAKIPSNPRSIILRPTYYESLAKDQVVVSSTADRNTALSTGRVGPIHGIQPYSYNGTIPNNGESLEGFACNPSAICLAARMPITPQNWYGLVESVVEPVTGLPIQFRYFYDGVEHRLQMMVQAGAAAGNPGALYRLVSA